MLVEPGIYMLEISLDLFGRQETIYPVLLAFEGAPVLVDAAYPGQAGKIRAAVEKCGIKFTDIRKIMVTHHDIDHMGSLAALLKMLPPGVRVLAHEKEIAYLTGRQPPAKWNPQCVADMEDQLGRPNAALRLAIKGVFANYHRLVAPVDQALADGDYLPDGGGLSVIHTPGHSPGHICLYHHSSQTLIAGDALFVSAGQLWATPPFLNLDQEQYRQSLARLLAYDIRTVCCYHGGVLRSRVNERLAELAAI